MSDPGAARVEAGHRRLRVSMAAGSFYDLVFAVINLAAPGLGSWFLEIPLPDDELYLRVTGVFLLALALFYMLPVIYPGRYLGNVLVAIAARLGGAVFFIAAALAFGRPPAFLLLGLIDLLFAVMHVVFLRQAGWPPPDR